MSGELKKEGYSVATASDGDEAIALIKKEKFELVLLDIKLPGLDGFEVLKFIKKSFPAMKVIMLTGFADLKNAIESKKLGADDFVEKPCSVTDISASIERILNG